MEEVTRAAKLIGTDVDFFVDTFMKPKLKVGKDFVKKGQNKDQVAFAISGILGTGKKERIIVTVIDFIRP